MKSKSASHPIRPAGIQAMGPDLYAQVQKVVRAITRETAALQR